MQQLKKLCKKMNERTQTPMDRKEFFLTLLALGFVNMAFAVFLPMSLGSFLDSWYGLSLFYSMNLILIILSFILSFIICTKRFRSVFFGKDNFFIYFYLGIYFFISLVLPPIGFLLTALLATLPAKFNYSDFYSENLSSVFEGTASKSFELYESLRLQDENQSKSV